MPDIYKKTILLVEDEPVVADIEKTHLQNLGYNIISANTGEKAIEVFNEKNAVNLILMDINLGNGMDGTEAARIILKSHNIPIIFISNHTGLEVVEKTENITSYGFVVKNSGINVLDASIKMAFKLFEANQIIKENENFHSIKNNELTLLNGKLSTALNNLQAANEELIATNEELAKSEKKWRTLFEILPVGVSILDADRRITDFNQRLGTILGITKEGLKNQIYNKRKYLRFDKTLLIYDEFPSTIAVKENRVVKNVEIGVMKEDDSIVWTNVSAAPLSLDDASCVIVTADITKRKIVDDKIKNLLTEKELILKEVHHRIKNNMSTIKNLLFFQAESLTDSSASAALMIAGNRVNSMMILYDKLYSSDNFKEISVMDYIPSLAETIVTNFPNSESVKIDINIDDFVLDVKKLQPLGIVINELLTNIMKYAFTGSSDRLITISATLTGNAVSFIIADNGHGLPESVNFKKSSGFGLQLVGILIDQIGGKIRIERNGGTKFIIEFGI